MVQKSTEKSLKLKEASKQQTFNAGVKDTEFWLGLIESQLNNNDYGKDLVSVQNLIKKHQLTEADIKSHEDQIADLNQTAATFTQQGSPDHEKINGLINLINNRYDNIKNKSNERLANLIEANNLYQFIRDLDDEDAWIKEKKLLVKSEDYGRDLNSVQNLKKKHKRLENELHTHEPIIGKIINEANRYRSGEESGAGDDLLNNPNLSGILADINKKCDQLINNWEELKDLYKDRLNKLNDSLNFHIWSASVDEERSWINEKQHQFNNMNDLNALSSTNTSNDSLAVVKNLLKKHEAFETDLNVHKERILHLNEQANELRNNSENAQYNDQITELINSLNRDIELLEQNTEKRKTNMLNNLKYLQFYWKTDVIESWINEKIKQLELANNDIGYNLSTIQNLIAKHDTFEAGLQAFEQNEGINALNELKEQLLSDSNVTSERAANINSKYDHIIECWNKLRSLSKFRLNKLYEQKNKFKDIDELYLKFAKKASSFNSWFENAEEDLTDPVRCNSIEEINELLIAHERFQSTLSIARQEFEELKQLDAKIKSLQVGPNPYTWFTMETLKDTWRSLEKAISDRKQDLDVEKKRQIENDTYRQQFAAIANEFYSWLQATRSDIIEYVNVAKTLDDQLEYTNAKSQVIKDNVKSLKNIEELNLKLEEKLILDNKYTEHSTLSLAQAYDQLNQLGLRMQHNLEQQIQACNQSGVNESSLREFSMMFKHFDKNKSGKLDHDEFKSCLMALGYEFQQNDARFEEILDKIDPNRDGQISLTEYMALMISRETENISSISDVIAAFKALTESSDRPYITREELAAVSRFYLVKIILNKNLFIFFYFKNLSPELTDYCIRKMKPYKDKSGREILNAYDYEAFTHELFNAS